MSNENILRSRSERKQAFVEVMLLAAAADGKVSQVEIQTVLRRVLERPEFEGTRPDELNALVEASAQRLAIAKNLDDILKSLRLRLPDHESRLLAFGLAAAVALADHRATRAELGLLKTIQAALGISEDEVALVFEIVEKGGSLSEALGTSTERLFAEVMVLMSVADGQLKEAEARAMVENLSADPLFQDVSSERAQLLIEEAVVALAQEGMPSRLKVLASGLSSHAQRLKAFRLAFRVASASGRVAPAEERMLNTLQATFGLADDEVERIAREA